jgi:iron complex transport system ATP-binding protein
MTLARDAPRVFLDDPTNHPDVGGACEVLVPVAWLNRAKGCSCVIVLHDLDTAICHADRVVLFDGGRAVIAGAMGDILTRAHVEAVFGVRCRIVALPGREEPVLVAFPQALARACGFTTAAEWTGISPPACRGG